MGDHRPKIEQVLLRQLLRALGLSTLALLQATLAPSLWGIRVEWVLLAVVGWTMVRGLTPGMRWALYGGLALDLIEPLPVGSHLLALLLCVLAVALLTEPLQRDQPVLAVVAALGATLLYELILALVLQLSGVAVPWRSYPLVVMLPEALLNAIVIAPLYALLLQLDRRRQPAVDL